MGVKSPIGLFVASAAFTILVFLTAAVSIHAQHLPIKTYTTADGLAQNLIFRIVRDSRGYMWFCTAEGLSRFDGYRFVNYTTDHGLPHRSVRGLLETRSGVYWVATGDGLCRFKPRATTRNQQTRESAIGNPQSMDPMFAVYHPAESAQSRSITVLLEDRSGTIWVGTAGGLYRLDYTDGQMRLHFVDMNMPNQTADDRLVQSILEDSRGGLWVGTRGSGLYRLLPDGGVERYTTLDGLPNDRVNALLEDNLGQLWVGTTGGLCLLVREPKPNRQVIARTYGKIEFGLGSSWVAALFQSSDGRIWVGNSTGLSEFMPVASGYPQEFKSYAAAQGLNHLDLTALAEDNAGNLWVGATGGLMKLARNGFVTYSTIGGRKPLNVSSLLESQSGEIFIVAREQSGKRALIRFDEKLPTIIKPNFPKQITYFGWGVNKFLQDRAGEWWIPTGQGLCRFPRVNRVEQLAHIRPKAVYTVKDGLIADEIWRIYEDSRGDIWICSFSLTNFGVTRWERSTETFHRYNEADGLPAGIGAFCEDASGNLWIGGKGTLTRYASGRFTVFAAADGVPQGHIDAIYREPSGRLWVATDSGGLSRIDDPTNERPGFLKYSTANGLSSNQVFCVTSDHQGRIYAFTGRGLDRLDPATGQVKHYTTFDGLVAGTPSAAFCDRQGVLWFGTDLGLSRLIPEVDSPQSPPPILISSLRIAGEPHLLSELGETDMSEIRLGANENQIQIDFVGLNFGTGEQLRYQYELEGADAGWSAPTDQRSINYAHLAPGTYRFMVRAVTSDGLTSESPASVRFTILPPIWQRWWFLASAATLFLVAAYFLYGYRVAHLIELERVRTRIATDLHDDIGANLTLIAMASEVARLRSPKDDAQIKESLSLISDTSRELVDSMGDIVWAVNPSKDHLRDLTKKMRRFASDVFSASNISFRFQAPGDEQDIKLGVDTRREVFLIFKESVNNIVRHSECSEAEIELEARAGRLLLKLKDDGKGFDVKEASDGTGLASMRKRAASLDGNLEVVSNNGKGTTVTLRVPLGHRGRA